MNKKFGVVDYCDGNAWYLIPDNKKIIVWKERKKAPKWFIDLMNGKKVKMRLNLKDWRFTYGSCE